MIESPLLQEYVSKAEAVGAVRGKRKALVKAVLKVVGARIEHVPAEVEAAVRAVVDEAKLDELMDLALGCPDLDSVRARLMP